MLTQYKLKNFKINMGEEDSYEMMYQATMSIARKMLRDGLIYEDEYRQIDTMFIEIYQPKMGVLFVDLQPEQR